MSEESFGKSGCTARHLPVGLKGETALYCILWHNCETVKNLDKDSDLLYLSRCLHACRHIFHFKDKS